MKMSDASPPIALMWENFGPSHHDRLRAVARCGIAVCAIELFSRSVDYNWERSEPGDYKVVTLCTRERPVSAVRLAARLVGAVRRSGARSTFFCHYDLPAVFLAACILRLTGRRVFTMADSKFDDYPRRWPRTLVKALFLAPYCGAVAASRRSRDYLAYLGVPGERIRPGFDTLDIARLQALAGPGDEVDHSQRPFLVAARLIQEKNIATALAAFGLYRERNPDRRRLVIIGDGPLRSELEARASQLGIAAAVDWRGSCSGSEVAKAMRGALALLLPSLQDTFGLVVIEAFAQGLPVIVSNRAGATDELVENLINGFTTDPLSVEQIVAAMTELASDPDRHARMAAAALAASERGDARHFAQAIAELAGR